MIHEKRHYIGVVSLALGDREPPRVCYSKILSDFQTGDDQRSH